MRKIYYLPILIFLFSCQIGKEFHYFKQGDNYYRITVKERAFLSSSRYESGYYDEDAVDNYFGEIHRPDSSGRVVPVSSKTDSSNSKDNYAIPPNTKLVMILSTNADAVADQISNLADNEQTLEIIARLTNKNLINENNSLKQAIANKNKKDSSLIDFGNNTIGAIQDSDKTVAKLPQTTSLILAFINSIAASKGRKTPFETIVDAKKWFYENY